MSVRRLAENEHQPEEFKFNRSMGTEVKKWIKKYPEGREQSAVIPLLMLAQEQDGWVSKSAIEHVADLLRMPYIRVLEVATFYTQFQLKPVGIHAHIQICGTTPCMLRGSEELIALCQERINAEPFKTNTTGTMSWEEVECQGACVNAPMVMIFKDSYEDLTPERLSHIIDCFEAGKGHEITPGPQIDRVYSAAYGGQTNLTESPIKIVAKAARASSLSSKKKASKAPAIKAKMPTKTSVKTPAKTSVIKPQTISALKDKGLEDKARPPQMARLEKPDNLKLISGIGPKLEGALNELGIYQFGQIAKWKKIEREWVDNYLKFKGRIDRDDWLKQAKALAKGGEAEYIKIFGKKP